MNTFTQRYKQALNNLQIIWLWPILTQGTLAVALMPAAFTGLAVGSVSTASYHPVVAGLLGAITAFAFESINIKVIHTATELYENGRHYRAALLGIIALCVACIVSMVIYHAHGAFPPLVQNIGIASPWLTIAMYLASAFALEIETASQQAAVDAQSAAQAKAEDRVFNRELRRERMHLEHTQRLAEIERGSVQGVQSERSAVQSVQSGVQLERSTDEQLNTILNMFSADPTISQRAIAGRLGVSVGTVNNRIKGLREQGRLKRNGAGYKVVE